MEKTRLAKYLAAAGVASRRKCEDLIASGCVKVNGQVTLVPQTMVDDNDTITFNGTQITRPEFKVYFILNKPSGYHCSPSKNPRQKLVLDLFKSVKKRLFTVGRLDRDTTGLLIVTNDGEFCNKVIHPSSNIRKEYIVKTSQEVTADHLKVVSKGTEVEGTFVRPVKVAKIRRGTLKIVVSEGKKREVRRLVEAAGLEVKELKRTRIGGLRMGEIPIGSWRELTEREREMIFE